ncbi:MAG: hypothetical protein HUK15_01335, partial [Bacteroidales bacterium]|nr:hypothetical protein [Bacteroidales bacterium]
KFKMKTCACKTSGGYFKGYFVVHGDKFIKLSLNLKGEILNKNEINKFIEDEGYDYEIPAQITKVPELIEAFEKIMVE